MITLTRGEIHLWAVELDQPPEVVRRLYALCTPDEHARAHQFHAVQDQARWIVGRGALRHILSQYRDIDPAALRFAYGTWGKPSLIDVDGLAFNLAHSGGLAVIGVVQGVEIAEIGIDVEWVQPVPEMDEIAARLFSSQEIRELDEATSVIEKQARFFTVWTRKEAYLKAVGTGLVESLPDVHVSALPSDQPRTLTLPDAHGQPVAWNIFDVVPAAGYVGAVAIRAGAWRLIRREWEL